jgi:hypothetical protein
VISFGLFTVIKIGVSIAAVVGLSLIAEWVGPRFAGIVAGYPLGAAISLFFIGAEINPAFAAHSAIFTSAGLAATVAFVSGYLLGLRWGAGRSLPTSLALSILTSLAGFTAAAWVISSLPINRVSAPLIALAAIVIAGRAFHAIPEAVIEDKIRLSVPVAFFRAAFAALIIVGVTLAARFVGPRWAGLLSAFPITMMPLLMIIHAGYQPAHVRAIIRNVPRGLGSLLIYTLIVTATYPPLGIAWGTILGYLGATAYLVLLERYK